MRPREGGQLQLDPGLDGLLIFDRRRDRRFRNHWFSGRHIPVPPERKSPISLKFSFLQGRYPRSNAVIRGNKPTPAVRRAAYFHCESSRSEEHTSELQSLMRISYAVFCLKKK